VWRVDRGVEEDRKKLIGPGSGAVGEPWTRNDIYVVERGCSPRGKRTGHGRRTFRGGRCPAKGKGEPDVFLLHREDVSLCCESDRVAGAWKPFVVKPVGDQADVES